MGIKKGLILLGMILVLSGIGWGLNCEGYEENNCYTLTDLGPGTLVCSKYSEVLDKFAMQCGQKWPLEDFQDIIGVNYGFGDVSCNVIHNMGAIFNQFTYSFNEEKELGQVIIIAGVSGIGPALKDVSIEVIFYNGAEKVGSEVFGLETSCNKDEEGRIYCSQQGCRQVFLLEAGVGVTEITIKNNGPANILNVYGLMFIHLKEDCANTEDDDKDGFTDCQDPDCENVAIGTVDGSGWCEPNGETICDDDFDNDMNGKKDCEDKGCKSNNGVNGVCCLTNFDCEGGATCGLPDADNQMYCEEQDCTDGVDNDNDGLTDCQEDICVGIPFCIDNDGDGFNQGVDCDDEDITVYPGTEEIGNGIDDDCDGLIDGDDPDCDDEDFCNLPEGWYQITDEIVTSNSGKLSSHLEEFVTLGTKDPSNVTMEKLSVIGVLPDFLEGGGFAYWDVLTINLKKKDLAVVSRPIPLQKEEKYLASISTDNNCQFKVLAIDENGVVDILDGDAYYNFFQGALSGGEFPINYFLDVKEEVYTYYIEGDEPTPSSPGIEFWATDIFKKRMVVLDGFVEAFLIVTSEGPCSFAMPSLVRLDVEQQSDFIGSQSTGSSCCPEGWCWDGEACVGNMATNTFQYDESGGAIYRCIDGDWKFVKKVKSWTGESGFCSEESKCFLSNEGGYGLSTEDFYSGNIPACVDDKGAIFDHYCEGGNWTTRTKQLALGMLDFVKNKNDYVLYCTDYEDNLVEVEDYDIDGDVDSKYILNTNYAPPMDLIKENNWVNNFCLLRYKDGSDLKTLVGTTLNKYVNGTPFDRSTTQNSILNTFGANEDFCEPAVEDSKLSGNFESCGNAPQDEATDRFIFYSQPINAVVYGNDQFVPTGMLSTIVDYFVDLWNDLFGGETVPIDVPENFNELYVLKSTDDTGAVKEAKVIIEENFNGEKQLVGEYNGFETDICGYINNTVMIGINEVNSFSLEGVLECSHDTGVFKVKMEEEPVSGELGEIGGEKFSPIDWWWIRLTGRLRPQWLK